MRALFVHDHTFTRTADGTYYSPGKLPFETWRRYTEVFGQLDVLARVTEGDATSVHRMNRSSGPGVTFHGAPTAARARKRLVTALLDSTDAVIARLPSRLGLLAGTAALDRGIPMAVEVAGCARDAYRFHGSLLARLYSPIAWLRTRSLVGRSPFALYVTDEYLQRLYPSAGITSNVSNVALPPPSDAILSERLTKVQRRPTSLGMVGGLGTSYKGWAVAIRALRRLRGSHPELELRILGGGDPEPWLRQAQRAGVAAVVHFDGLLPAGQPVFEWLDQRDIFLLPSQTEGLPRALLEAMSRAIPAVASAVSDVPALIDSRFLHAPSSAEDLVRVLTPLLSSAELRAEAARSNHSRAKDFASPVLNERRQAFWREFADYVATCGLRT